MAERWEIRVLDLLNQSSAAFLRFCEDNRICGAVFFPGNNDFLRPWQAYMRDVAQPINRQIRDILLEQDEETRRDPYVRRFLRYVEDYDTLIEAWNHGSTQPHIGRNFPREFEFAIKMRIPGEPA